MSGRGPREDQMLREVTASVPPYIAALEYRPDSATAVHVDAATAAISALDAGAGTRLAAIGGLLLRSESVSSSRIERVNATRDDFARALAGSRSSQAARATVAAARALTAMIDAAGASERIDIADVRHAHTELMRDDPGEQEYAGRLRDRPSWIGGSNDSPRNAIHVPPPPELVPDLMDDLLQFAYRDGEVDAFVSYLATSSVVAAQAAVQSAAELAELPDRWRELAAPRGGSTAARLLDLLLANPVVDVRDVQNLTGSLVRKQQRRACPLDRRRCVGPSDPAAT